MKCNLRFFGQEPIEKVGRPRLDLRNSHIRSTRVTLRSGGVAALIPTE